MTKIGVNKYTEGVDMEVELHEYKVEWAQLKIERLQNLKKTRITSPLKNRSRPRRRQPRQRKT